MGKAISTGVATVNLRLVGTTPLLLHNIQMADPRHPIVQEIKAVIAAFKGKSISEEEMATRKARLQFLGSLYWDDLVGVYMPGFNVLRSVMKGGSSLGRLGKKVDEAILDYTEKCPIEPYASKYDNPEDMYDDGHELTTMVRVNSSRVLATRPQFLDWHIDWACEVDTSQMPVDLLVQAARQAGTVEGIGDGRLKGYRKGRYIVEVL